MAETWKANVYDPCRWLVTPVTINLNSSSFQNEGYWLATDTTLAREMGFKKERPCFHCSKPLNSSYCLTVHGQPGFNLVWFFNFFPPLLASKTLLFFKSLVSFLHKLFFSLGRGGCCWTQYPKRGPLA